MKGKDVCLEGFKKYVILCELNFPNSLSNIAVKNVIVKTRGAVRLEQFNVVFYEMYLKNKINKAVHVAGKRSDGKLSW